MDTTPHTINRQTDPMEGVSHHQERPPNPPFFTTQGPPSFAPQSNHQQPVAPVQHSQQQQQQSSHEQPNLPPIMPPQHRREPDIPLPRNDGPASFQQPGPRQDQMSQHELLAQSQQLAANQQTVVQAAQRAAEAGYRPLNVKDALSYLDQVKIQFYDQPDVYNRFLDIMKDFKSQRYGVSRKCANFSIDTPGVIERVSTLFRGHPSLVQGFNTFLPPGYRIECSLDPSDPNPIRVTTPQGTVNQVNGQNGGPTRFSAPVPNSSSQNWRNDDQYAANAAYGMTMVSQAANQHAGQNGNGEKKPVEFNHAINYVNKIKTRFANEPDTYKHFLEILQTYQKDAKPIQEVYSQVTELFKGAQDLLQDFKQFLPENNASASAAARLPAVGTFAPPQQTAPAPVPRDRKRRPAEPPARTAVTKKTKSTHRPIVDSGPVSPNLMPGAPEPLTPAAARAGASIEEVAFFDRAKKYINNKPASAEFFKVLNLYTQEIIDKGTLVEKIDNFIGGHKELMDAFKRIVGFTGVDDIYDSAPATSRPKVDLSLCKAFGPSYRQLPKSETLLPCSGRDDMCWEVLNDVYVSHPTWASEDAGFVSHKKNQYEEALHKIEEERYEYDLNIEANLRTIQLLEPIAQRISNMHEEEKRQFKLQPGLGGQSIAIYQKVIKKIYDKSRGQEVIDQLHENPVIAVPVVLKRLKQKDEEWKRAQREWNKVWRETEAKNYYKSLDHQGTFFKTADKKAMSVRNMTAEIESLRRIQDEKRHGPGVPKPRYQYEFNFDRHDICLDVQRLVGTQIDRMSVTAPERERMMQFNQNFIPQFFGINIETIIDSAGGDADDIAAQKAFSSGVSTRRKKAGEEVDLLRSIMKRTREAAHNRSKKKPGEDEMETAPPSRASTPMNDDRMSDDSGAQDKSDEEAQKPDESRSSAQEAQVWTEVSHDPTARVVGEIVQPPPTTETQSQRHLYNLFSNSTFYCYLRWFQMVYERLTHLKLLEDEVTRELKARKPNQTAVELGLVVNRLSSMAIETSDDTDHYEQLLILCDHLIEQTLDQGSFEDMMRHIYGTKGYKIYTVDKLTNFMAKQIHSIVTDDKNIAQTTAFMKDRAKPTTTTREQVIYRIQTEATIGSNEVVYRSEWDNDTRNLRIQLMGKEDVTHAEATNKEEAWKYYIAAWTVTKPTPGVPQDTCKPCLTRNLPSDDDPESYQDARFIQSRLEVKICMNTYKLFYVKNTEDVLFLREPLLCPPSTRKAPKFKTWLNEQSGDRANIFDVEMT